MKVLDTLNDALKEKLDKDNLVRQVWRLTGFTGEDAEELIRLLLMWHYVSQDREIQRRLAHYGVRVGVLPQTDKEQK